MGSPAERLAAAGRPLAVLLGDLGQFLLYHSQATAGRVACTLALEIAVGVAADPHDRDA